MTVAGAKALGLELSRRDPKRPFTADETAWLAAQFATIALSPELVDAFLPTLTSNGWATLCDGLGAARDADETAARSGVAGRAEDDDGPQVPDIDSVFASLGAILTSDRARHPDSDPTTLLDVIEPYGAALLVQHLHLDADRLATVARSLIERERTMLIDPDHVSLGPRAADFLFDTMLVTPGAAHAFVVLSVKDSALLLDSADDGRISNRVLIAGTDPQSMPLSEAKIIVPTFMMAMLDRLGQPQWADHHRDLDIAAADLLAPYLLPMRRSTASGFGLSNEQRQAIQQFLLDDPAALARILDYGETVRNNLTAATSGTWAERHRAIADLAELIGEVDGLAKMATVHDAQHAQDTWNFTWQVISFAGSLLPTGGTFVGNVVGAGGGPALTAIRDGLEMLGVGPQSVVEAQRGAIVTYDIVTSVAAATVVGATFDQLVAGGLVPSNCPPPPVPDVRLGPTTAEVYGHDFDEWLVANESRMTEATRDQLSNIKETILSIHETSENETEQLTD